MIFINLLFLALLIYIIALLTYSMFWGAPFAALSQDRIKTMFRLLGPVKGKSFLDLGSGDGRIVMAASKKGLHANGYEINPLLVLISRLKLKKSKLSGQIYLKDYWHDDLGKFDYISVWGLPPMMIRLEKKLLRELKPGTKVVSNHLQFPSWKFSKKENDVYLYIKS